MRKIGVAVIGAGLSGINHARAATLKLLKNMQKAKSTYSKIQG